jgi:Tfp pilus assembly protein PilO
MWAGESDAGPLRSEIAHRRQQLGSRLAELNAGVPVGNDISGLLQLLFDKAWESKIRIDKTEPLKERIADGITHIPVVLQFNASYARAGSFITALESMPQAVRIDRIAFDAMNSGGVDAKVMVTCHLPPVTEAP